MDRRSNFTIGVSGTILFASGGLIDRSWGEGEGETAGTVGKAQEEAQARRRGVRST